RMRRGLEQQTQHTDDSLLEFVRVIQGLFEPAEPSVPNPERVERIIRQSHTTYTAYIRGSRIRDLNELASKARRIQEDILAAQAYRPHRQRQRHSSRAARGTGTRRPETGDTKRPTTQTSEVETRTTSQIMHSTLTPMNAGQQRLRRRLTGGDRNTELPTLREETWPKRPYTQDERRSAHQNARQDSR
ncbi:hypothetical protein HPB47_019126, partial [Ixodes persulcatus]